MTAGLGASAAPPVVAIEAASDTVLLGIDPGTRVLGYGAVAGSARRPRLVEAGVVRVHEKRPLAERLERMAAALEELLAELRPAVVVVERAFAGRNIQSALRLGECRGIALAAAQRAGATVVELSPAQAKRAVAGHGAATKDAVARMVLGRLGVDGPDAPLDATDALALALAWQQDGGQLAALRVRVRRPAFAAEVLARLGVASAADLVLGARPVLSRRRRP